MHARIAREVASGVAELAQGEPGAVCVVVESASVLGFCGPPPADSNMTSLFQQLR